MQMNYLSYSSGRAIVPSDSVPVACRGIWVGGAGALALTFGPPGAPGTTVVFSAVPAGTLLPFNLDQGFINATGTTATLIVALA